MNLHLFQPPPALPKKEKEEVVWPSWFTPSKEAITQNKNVSAGKHPIGAPLMGGDRQCKTCASLFRTETRSGKVYLKCFTTKTTKGRGTDIRAKWPACVFWKHKNA